MHLKGVVPSVTRRAIETRRPSGSEDTQKDNRTPATLTLRSPHVRTPTSAADFPGFAPSIPRTNACPPAIRCSHGPFTMLSQETPSVKPSLQFPVMYCWSLGLLFAHVYIVWGTLACVLASNQSKRGEKEGKASLMSKSYKKRDGKYSNFLW